MLRLLLFVVYAFYGLLHLCLSHGERYNKEKSLIPVAGYTPKVVSCSCVVASYIPKTTGLAVARMVLCGVLGRSFLGLASWCCLYQ